MKISYLLLSAFLITSLQFSAQKASKNNTNKTVSIYTFSSFSYNKNSISALNQKLKLNNFDFVYVNQMDLDLNQFSIQINNLGKKPSKFIYDDYIAYRDENLLKGWFRKHDPTRWNLQCPNPPNVQSTE